MSPSSGFLAQRKFSVGTYWVKYISNYLYLEMYLEARNMGTFTYKPANVSSETRECHIYLWSWILILGCLWLLSKLPEESWPGKRKGLWQRKVKSREWGRYKWAEVGERHHSLREKKREVDFGTFFRATYTKKKIQTCLWFNVLGMSSYHISGNFNSSLSPSALGYWWGWGRHSPLMSS